MLRAKINVVTVNRLPHIRSKQLCSLMLIKRTEPVHVSSGNVLFTCSFKKSFDDKLETKITGRRRQSSNQWGNESRTKEGCRCSIERHCSFGFEFLITGEQLIS